MYFKTKYFKKVLYVHPKLGVRYGIYKAYYFLGIRVYCTEISNNCSCSKDEAESLIKQLVAEG